MICEEFVMYCVDSVGYAAMFILFIVVLMDIVSMGRQFCTFMAIGIVMPPFIMLYELNYGDSEHFCIDIMTGKSGIIGYMLLLLLNNISVYPMYALLSMPISTTSPLLPNSAFVFNILKLLEFM
jgi:hypothetical protein